MFDKIAGSMYLPISLLFFCLSYIYFFPSMWMITDAYSYSTQALAFASGNLQYLQNDFLTGETININRAPYNLGNACYLSFFVFIFGAKHIFMQLLRNWNLPKGALAILFVSAPILFFSRCLMSCMPSLLVISCFMSLFTKEHKGFRDILLLGFLAGLSTWLRETNIVITGLMCLYLLMKQPNRFWLLLFGGILGVTIRLVSSYVVYGQIFFVSASSGFSLESLIHHIPLYLFMSIILVPLGLISSISMKEQADKLFIILTILFLILYSGYNYTAVEYSGFLKGSLLTSRFIIPWIPLAIVGTGFAMLRYNYFEKIMRYCIIPFSLLLIPISQYVINKLYNSHENAAKQLSEKYEHAHIVYDQSGFTNIIRYINPLTGEWKQTADIPSLERYLTDPASLKKDLAAPIFLILSMGDETEAKRNRSNTIKDKIPTKFVDLVDTFPINESNRLEVYKLK
ncbi:hypothetical protein N9B82_05805 [Saprospiraceae bacterium]|nr:hypothetical protein [Saprospiraceae bacterium]